MNESRSPGEEEVKYSQEDAQVEAAAMQRISRVYKLPIATVEKFVDSTTEWANNVKLGENVYNEIATVEDPSEREVLTKYARGWEEKLGQDVFLMLDGKEGLGEAEDAVYFGCLAKPQNAAYSLRRRNPEISRIIETIEAGYVESARDISSMKLSLMSTAMMAQVERGEGEEREE